MDPTYYAKHTYDAESELRLWEDSLKIVSLEDDRK